MNNLRYAAFVVLVSGALSACKDEGTLSTTPSIGFISLEPRVIRGANAEDSTFLEFRFTDGDADLGVGSAATGQDDIFLIDSRDGTELKFLFPNIADELRDPAKGMTGTVVLIMPAALITPRTDSLHMATGDTLRYEVYVKDRAGHESNRFTTPDLFLTPP